MNPLAEALYALTRQKERLETIALTRPREAERAKRKLAVIEAKIQAVRSLKSDGYRNPSNNSHDDSVHMAKDISDINERAEYADEFFADDIAERMREL